MAAMNRPASGAFFELVAAGTDSDVKAGEIGAVVDWGPVIGDVVDSGDSYRFVRHAQVCQATRRAGHLRVEPLLSDPRFRRIWILEPFDRVALRLRPADEQLPAGGWAEVDAEI